MVWTPLNLSEVCPTHTHLSACSHFAYVYLNLLVQLYGDSRDRRLSEKIDREDDSVVQKIASYEHRREEYDFIVVGAGAAGCVVANRLSQNRNWKVLLLEAGPEQPDVSLVPGLSTVLLGSNVDWAYTTEPDGKSCLASRGGRCAWPRGKMMGGSSAINSLAYIRGSRLDYDTWADLGNVGWSYRDVLPYFKKSERNLNFEGLNRKYHGVTGEQYISRYPYFDKPSIMITDAFHERGLPLTDYNGAHQIGAMQAQSISLDGERISTNTAFIRPIRFKRKNLTVKPNSEAVKILIDEHKRAYGVKYKKNNLMYTAFAKKEVIVSGGPINAPKLLMLSGIGPKDQLENAGIEVIKELAVGENLHDHVTFNGIIIVVSNNTTTLRTNDEVLQEVIDYYKMDIKRGPLSGNGAVSSVSFIKTEPDLPAPDIQYQVDSIKWREYVNEPIDYDRTRIYPTGFYDGLIPRTMNLVPYSRGRLCLNTTDPNGHPLLYANYYDDERDLIPLIKGVRFLLSLEDTEAFKKMGAHFLRVKLPACKDYEWGTDEYIVCLARHYTSTPYHPVGSCKMGPKWDEKAVVDPRLRVYGISGLRVIDSSIMPIVPRGNTNAPSIMVGERGVALVIEDWTHNYKHKQN
ncbi:PREDICTED: glucose dehydrogenase [FAD, quinone]-like [Papilio xuthus]|uniref:Glucose dehydrogenase [FAD, quinone]-like n=1 Tax=Papilio xuthus TaxID=66420 RepID=A0AAJ6Z2Q4_PAPXU|nr:PREDICTED: glucose dehydrogenase [FAD, quinone]-like [Papilio xuthus]